MLLQSTIKCYNELSTKTKLTVATGAIVCGGTCFAVWKYAKKKAGLRDKEIQSRASFTEEIRSVQVESFAQEKSSTATKRNRETPSTDSISFRESIDFLYEKHSAIASSEYLLPPESSNQTCVITEDSEEHLKLKFHKKKETKHDLQTCLPTKLQFVEKNLRSDFSAVEDDFSDVTLLETKVQRQPFLSSRIFISDTTETRRKICEDVKATSGIQPQEHNTNERDAFTQNAHCYVNKLIEDQLKEYVVKSKLQENDSEFVNRAAVEEPQEILETQKKECAILNISEDILGDQEAVDKPERNKVCENETTTTLDVAYSLYPLPQHLCGTGAVGEDENYQCENNGHNIGKLSDRSETVENGISAEFSNSLPDLKTEDILNDSHINIEDKTKIETPNKAGCVEEVSNITEIIWTDQLRNFFRKNDTKPQLEIENNKMVTDLEYRIEENVAAVENKNKNNRATISYTSETVEHATKEVITDLLHEVLIHACESVSVIKNDTPLYFNNCSEYNRITIKSSTTEKVKSVSDINETIVNNLSSEWQDLPYESSRQDVNSLSEKQDKDALNNNYRSIEGEVNTELYNRAGKVEMLLDSNETKKTGTSSEIADVGKNTRPDLGTYSDEMEKELKYLFKKDQSSNLKLDLEKEMDEIEKQLIDLCEEKETNGNEKENAFVLEMKDIGENELQEQDYMASQSHSIAPLFCCNCKKTIVEANEIGSIQSCNWVIVSYKHPDDRKSPPVTNSATKFVTQNISEDIEGDYSNDRKYDGDSDEANSSNMESDKKSKFGPLENLIEPNSEDDELFVDVTAWRDRVQDKEIFFLIWLSTIKLEDIMFCDVKINLNRQIYNISRQRYDWLEMLYNMCEDRGYDFCSKLKVTDDGIQYLHITYKVNEKTRNQRMEPEPKRKQWFVILDEDDVIDVTNNSELQDQFLKASHVNQDRTEENNSDSSYPQFKYLEEMLCDEEVSAGSIPSSREPHENPNTDDLFELNGQESGPCNEGVDSGFVSDTWFSFSEQQQQTTDYTSKGPWGPSYNNTNYQHHQNGPLPQGHFQSPGSVPHFGFSQQMPTCTGQNFYHPQWPTGQPLYHHQSSAGCHSHHSQWGHYQYPFQAQVPGINSWGCYVQAPYYGNPWQQQNANSQPFVQNYGTSHVGAQQQPFSQVNRAPRWYGRYAGCSRFAPQC